MAGKQPSTSNALTGKKVVVVGASIGGLSFVISLFKQYGNPLPFELVIYERDSRDLFLDHEGSSLTIHGDAGGVQALKTLGILAPLQLQARQKWRALGGFVVWDGAWNPVVKMPVEKDKDGALAELRIPRSVLRRTMTDAVPEHQKIQWETTCETLERLGDGKVRVTLSSGQAEDCDVLIVADGASSKLRACIRPDDNLVFQGPVSIAATARFPEGVPEPVDEHWGIVLGGHGVGLFVSPIDATSALWSLSYLASEPRTPMRQPLEKHQIDALMNEAAELGKNFTEPFPTLFRATDPSTIRLISSMDKQPFDHQAHPEIIFIGDSNHAAAPFVGNGDNMAIIDGVDLAESLSQSTSLQIALERYDKKSLPRCTKAIRDSHWRISLAHAKGWTLWVYIWFLWFLSYF